MHALLYALVGLDCHAQQLHAIAKLVSPFEIFGCNGGDPFHINCALIDFRPESQARQNRELLRRIMALDIEGRIRFGVTEPLRLLQTLRESELLLFHTRQDVIAGAIENSIDACERIAGQALAQRFHDGNGTTDRSLEIEGDVVLLGNGGQCDAVPGKQSFIGGDDRFLGRERRRDRGTGGIALSADQFDEHVDLAIRREGHGIDNPTQLTVPNIALLAA